MPPKLQYYYYYYYCNTVPVPSITIVSTECLNWFPCQSEPAVL